MRTLYGAALATSNYLNIDHEVLPNTTLNKKFGTTLEASSERLALRYFAVGFKEPIGSSELRLDQRQHKPYDGDLYNHLPFRLVLKDSRLTELERSPYRVEKLVTINTIEYYAYYIKVINTDPLERYIHVTDLAGGEMELFSTENENILNPVEGSIYSSNSALAYNKTLKLELTGIEMTNISEAFDLLFPDSDKVINDCMLVSGVDKELGSSIIALSMQANFFINLNLDVDSLTEYGQNILYEVGGMELSSLSTSVT